MKKKRKTKLLKLFRRLTALNLAIYLMAFSTIIILPAMLSSVVILNILYKDKIKDIENYFDLSVPFQTSHDYNPEEKGQGDKGSGDKSDSLAGNIITGVVDKNTKDMIKDYLNAITKASKSGQVEVPPWFIIGINIMEAGGFYPEKKPVPRTEVFFDKYGQNRADGTVMNFVTWGTEDVKTYGAQTSSNYDGDGVKGPFKIKQGNWDGGWAADGNNDGVKDIYNFYDSATATALRHAKDFESAKKLLGTEDKDVVFMYLANAHNAGSAGMNWRIPMDMKSKYAEHLKSIKNDHNTGDKIFQAFYDNGRGWKFRTPVYETLDKLGWSFNQKIIENMVNNGYTPTKPASNTLSNWLADSSGIRPGTGAGNPGEMTMIFKDTNGNTMAHNAESAEYAIAVYHLGTRTYEALMGIVGNNVSDEVIDSVSSSQVYYHWEKQGKTSPDPKIEGETNEVGWKGGFPIYVQSKSTNQISKTPWKFNGSRTNLGDSGCSLYALTSLIHGAGYGNFPVPNPRNNSNGLKNGKINITELAKVLPNGPIVSSHVAQIGYTIKTIGIGTKSGQDQLFQELKKGIPYVINTRRGTISGKTYDGKDVTTKFTSGGHFVLFVGAFESGGKRYVEVVQSTYSQAGRTSPDQNKMYFDFDNLIKVDVLKSSGGGAVPAYTIVGYPGKPSPRYLSQNYALPIVINKDKIVAQGTARPTDQMDTDNISNTKPEDLYNIYDLQQDMFGGLVKGNIGENITLKLPTTAVVEVSKDKLRIFISKKDYLEINNINPKVKSTQIYQSGTELGTTSKTTEVKIGYLDNGNYIYVDYNNIDVTND